MLHVPGKENRLSDIGSRVRANRMEGKLQDEMMALGMGDVVLKEEAVRWKSGDVNINVEDKLLALTPRPSTN